VARKNFLSETYCNDFGIKKRSKHPAKASKKCQELSSKVPGQGSIHFIYKNTEHSATFLAKAALLAVFVCAKLHATH
jgi:hypothetical protein